MRVYTKFCFITMLVLALITLCSVCCLANDFNFGIGTGATTGSWYGLGGTISKYMNREIPGVNSWPEVTGGSLSNIDLIESGELLLGFTSSHATFRLDEETQMPKDVGWSKSIRSIALIGYSHGTICVPEASKIQKVQDLKGKTISLGAPGTGQITPGIHLLEAAGIDWRKDVKNEWLQYGGMKDAMIAGRLDAFWFQMSIQPATFVMDLATSRQVRLLEIPIDLIEKVQEKYGKYIVPLEVEAGVYPWMDEPFASMANFSMFICHKDADEDLIYKITKLVCEKQEEMAEVYKQISDWRFNPEAMFIDEVIPLHPGAKKYYKEIGFLK